MRKLLRPFNPFDIQPDTLISSDLHLHERKEFAKVDETTGLNSRLVEGLDILQQIADILDAHPEIEWVYSLGDFFELKDKIPNHMLIEFQKMLSKIKSKNRIHTAILGNHDFNLPEYPTVSLFDITLATVPRCILRRDKVTVGFIPYRREFDKFLISLKSVNEQNPDIVFFHQETPGVSYETGRDVPGTFPKDLLLPNTLYISGHIHKSQVIGQIHYVGSPYQIRFSDEGQTRYTWLLNSKTKKMAPIELKYPKFISINFSGTEDIEIDKSEVMGNYIRITGEADASTWCSKNKQGIREQLEKVGAKGVSFQVQIIRQHQTNITTEMLGNDDQIITEYVQDNNGESQISSEELVRIGLDLLK